MSITHLYWSDAKEPLKVVEVTQPTADMDGTLTYEASFWEGEFQKYSRARCAVNRHFLTNYMSNECRDQNGLGKYALPPREAWIRLIGAPIECASTPEDTGTAA